MTSFYLGNDYNIVTGVNGNGWGADSIDHIVNKNACAYLEYFKRKLYHMSLDRQYTLVLLLYRSINICRQ